MVDYIEFFDHDDEEDHDPTAELFAEDDQIAAAPVAAAQAELPAVTEPSIEALIAEAPPEPLAEPLARPILDVSIGNGPRILALGVGGAGCNAIQALKDAGINGTELAVANTDIQDLNLCDVPTRIVLGPELCKGLGAGGKPEVGALAVCESEAEVRAAVEGYDLVFVVFGGGGGTGSGAGPEICQIARDAGALVLAVATKPFCEEGKRRRRHADEAFAALVGRADSVVVVANDRLADLCDDEASIIDGFAAADGVLIDAVRGLIDLANAPQSGRGKMNRDFQDVRTVMQSRERALMGLGVASGPDRATVALHRAISSPLLEDATLEGATGVLCHIRYGTELALTLKEQRKILALIHSEIDEDAEFMFGYCQDQSLTDELAVMMVATGFDRTVEEVPVLDAALGAEVRPARSAGHSPAGTKSSAEWRLGTAAAERWESQRAERTARAERPPAAVAPERMAPGVRVREAAQRIEQSPVAREQAPAARSLEAVGLQRRDADAAVVQRLAVTQAIEGQGDRPNPQAQPMATTISALAEPPSAATRRVMDQARDRPRVRFGAPEFEGGIRQQALGLDRVGEGEPSAQYVHNLTSLVPQEAAAERSEFVASTVARDEVPFAGRLGVISEARPARLVAHDHLQLEGRRQPDLLSGAEDLDRPPFLKD
jgi:cell division protein FtsZ